MDGNYDVIEEVNALRRYWRYVVFMIGVVIIGTYYFIFDGLGHLAVIWGIAALFVGDDLYNHWRISHWTYKSFSIMAMVITGYASTIYALAEADVLATNFGEIFIRPFSPIFAAIIAGYAMFARSARIDNEISSDEIRSEIEKITNGKS